MNAALKRDEERGEAHVGLNSLRRNSITKKEESSDKGKLLML